MKHIQGTSFTGNVTVSIKGKQPELFFQLCIDEDIPTWDIKKISKNECQGKVRLTDIRDVRKLHRNTDYKVSFLDRKGYPFIWRRFLRKKEVVISIVFVFLFIFFLSNIIWKVDIKGVPTDMEAEITKQLKKYGIHSGAWIISLDEPNVIQQKLMNDIPELLWIGIERKGTTYSLEGVEKIIVEKEKVEGPRNLIATKKGIITSMYISKGIPQANIHDYVEAGDLLVSGVMRKEEEDDEDDNEDPEPKKKTEVVAADGEVIAETWYESSVTVPLKSHYEMITGEKKHKYYISFGNLALPIWGFSDPDFKHIHRETSEKPLYFFKWKLPFTVDKTTLNEKEYKDLRRNKRQARKVAIEQAEQELQLRLGPEARITSHKILHEQKESGKVKLNIYFTVEEDITETQSINQGD
ncbi:MAG TPA: sporulation protein YqfD [Virgibacillus sp.]|nr:sporulation protein YqfD [Virgibacillus sp.]